MLLYETIKRCTKAPDGARCTKAPDGARASAEHRRGLGVYQGSRWSALSLTRIEASCGSEEEAEKRNL